jgi:hypothetical protein
VSYTTYTDRTRNRPGRQYGVVRANRHEQILVHVANNPGRATPVIALALGLNRDYTHLALMRLHEDGFVCSQWARVCVAAHTRERRVWHATALVHDLLAGRDHPGTTLGDIRQALRSPLTMQEIQRAVAIPLPRLRTILRLLVLQGDLRRVRKMHGECFALPEVLEDDEDLAA